MTSAPLGLALSLWGGGPAPVSTPSAYAAQGVQIHPDVGAKYVAGTFADQLRVVIFILWYGAPGSFANRFPNHRGLNSGVPLGQQNTVDSAETVKGINLLIDLSSPNNALYRLNASAATNKNANVAYGPDSSTPGIPSNRWVADLHAIDVAHATGAKIGGIMRDGTQLTSSVTQAGVAWDNVTGIGMSATDFFINCSLTGGSATLPGEYWAAQIAMWFPDATAMALLLNSDGTFKSDAFARFNTPGVGPKDLLADGTGPGIGAPAILHEWRAGDTFDTFFTNKGTAGNPVLIGSSNTAIKRVFRAPVDPVPAVDRPYRAGFYAVDTTALVDSGSGSTTYTGITNYGQRIKAGLTLIVIWVNMGWDSGGARNPSMADQHSVAYTRNKYVLGTLGETMVFTKLADANDETAQFADWGNAPILSWTKGGGFADGHPSINIGFYEAATFPVVADAQGAAKAGATTVTGFVCDAVTATSNKALMVCGLGFLSSAFEHVITPPSSMDPAVITGSGTQLGPIGGSMYIAEEKINATGSTGTRTFTVDANGGNAFREISILLQNG